MDNEKASQLVVAMTTRIDRNEEFIDTLAKQNIGPAGLSDECLTTLMHLNFFNNTLNDLVAAGEQDRAERMVRDALDSMNIQCVRLRAEASK